MRGQQGDEGMGLSNPNGPSSHPGGKRMVRHHNAVSTSNIYPLLPQRTQHNHNAGGLRPGLGREQSLPADIFLAIPPPGKHLGYPDPDAPTGIPPLLVHPSLSRPANSQQGAIHVQILLTMGQDRLSKEEVGELLDQRVHVATTT